MKKSILFFVVSFFVTYSFCQQLPKDDYQTGYRTCLNECGDFYRPSDSDSYVESYFKLTLLQACISGCKTEYGVDAERLEISEPSSGDAGLYQGDREPASAKGKKKGLFQKIDGYYTSSIYLISNGNKSISYLIYQTGTTIVELHLRSGKKTTFEIMKGQSANDYAGFVYNKIKSVEAPQSPFSKYCKNLSFDSVSSSCQRAFCDYLECVLGNDCNAGSKYEQLQTVKLMCGGTLTILDLSQVNYDTPLKLGKN
ncbi:MAG: hypothetical protein KDC85_18425 [Saprospiraceae bacterium]|nr:hypothetical protein [Saprospiraceae bacterium]MCB9322849.1 hypothetical protein [Lewinellaceae bacterium]